MNKEFATYKLALALKELGFDEHCFGEYYYGKLKYDEVCNGTVHTDIVLAPTYSQVFRWFREKHWLYPSVISHDDDNHIFTITGEKLYESDDEQDNFDSYEEAELACLDKLIEIVKEKQ